jgi:uncharacterized protein (DUF433 family)
MSDNEHPYRGRITINPNVMVGKPVVRGTRIPVERVLRHLEEKDRADLFAAFPELTEEDVRACLAFAREAIERQQRELLDVAGRM